MWNEPDAMKNVWETCAFSDDIISADFSKAKFAVELHEFLDNSAGSAYQDPEVFFDNTFPTDQMKFLVKDTLKRLESGRGQSTTVINTGFGGGKTHSLLLLHHIISSPNEGLRFIKKTNISSELGIEKIPNARVVTIDCRKISKNTLWGEIAHRLGQYEKFREVDANKRPVIDISQIKQLFDEPTLLLIDELPHHLLNADSVKIGNRTLADLTIAFVMTLISSISASAKSCMILTLTAKQKLYESYETEITSRMKTILDYRTDDVMDSLGEAVSRQSQMMTPVTRSQIYDVVKARLVKNINHIERDKTVGEYLKYYEERGLASPDMREKLEKSYPFHPYLIDTLYDRVSTISKFNQTRGMLRFLARVIRQIKEDRSDCKIIGLPDVQLANSEIADELTVRLGLDLRIVIDTDCIEHAREFDEPKRIKIVEAIAKTILIFSLHGYSKKSGIKRNDIKMAVGFPGLDPTLVDKALDDDIMENFWYIRDRDGQEFYFIEAPNINAIIFEHKKDVMHGEIRSEIGSSLQSILPSAGFTPIMWDESDLEDDETLKMFIMDYAKRLPEDQMVDYIANTIDRTNRGNIRTHKNTIVFVYADPGSVYVLENQAKNLAAIKKTKKDERIHADTSFMSQIASKESSAKCQLESDCMNVYCRVGYPYGVLPRLDEIRFGDSKKSTITGAVTELLENKGKLIRNIGSDGIEVPDGVKKIIDIYQGFKRDKSKPFLLNTSSFSKAIRDGTGSGKFGFCKEIKMADGMYVADINTERFDWNGYIVNKSKIYTKPPPPPGSGPGPHTPAPQPSPTFRYHIRFESFEKMHGFVNKITILNLDDSWKSSKKQFNARIRIGDTEMTIGSSAIDHMTLKGILNAVAGKNDVSGNGDFTVTSDRNLEDFLKKNEVEVGTY